MKTSNFLLFAFLLILIIGCTKEGPEGKRSLIFFEPEPVGENCPTGGYKINLGLDLNNNNFLETSEIENTEYICNGGNSILRLDPEPAGENCPSGGYKVMSGIDANNNSTLEDYEIQHTNFVCNGNNSLVDISPEMPGVNCASGGFKLMSGIDINNNGVLDESEIQNIEYICNGNDGTNSLFIIEPVLPGDGCENGGYKILSGLDTNWNHTLEEAEIQTIDYVCNGINSIYKVEPELPGENCENGGFTVNFGMDNNGNTILDDDEIEDAVYICNGLNGSSDRMIRLAINWVGSTTSTEGEKGIGIYGFNKDDYPGVDSIVFAGTPYSTRSINRSSIELYDFTSNNVIPGSRIFSNDNLEDAEIQLTGNLYDEIPSGNRNIGILIKSENDDYPAYMNGNCYLFLYRKQP
jgi:hypothetical protein